MYKHTNFTKCGNHSEFKQWSLFEPKFKQSKSEKNVVVTRLYNTAIAQRCIKLVYISNIDRAYTLKMIETFSLF